MQGACGMRVPWVSAGCARRVCARRVCARRVCARRVCARRVCARRVCARRVCARRACTHLPLSSARSIVTARRMSSANCGAFALVGSVSAKCAAAGCCSVAMSQPRRSFIASHSE
eukprot:7382813-Prymnesium_polylepis.2